MRKLEALVQIKHKPTRVLQGIISRLSQDFLLLILLLVLPLLLALMPAQWSGLPELVSWPTIAALTGLMVLSSALENSGSLTQIGQWSLRRLHGERRLAVFLVVFSALLAAVLTNDVALFIVVPLTLGLRTVIALPVARLVVFEALAVNAGSALSPVGNPQNLYLWQASESSFSAFVLALLPLGLLLLSLILLLIPLAFPAKNIEIDTLTVPSALNRSMAYTAAVLYPVFLILLDQGYGIAALTALLLLYLVCWPAILRAVDWQLLVTFILMFVVMGLVSRLPLMASLVRSIDELPGGLLTGAALLSQGISNVPATIFLERFTDDWRLLAWGVNIGGFGLAIASMANLIALRFVKTSGIWWEFHRWSVPLLLLSWILALGLLKLLPQVL